MDAPPESSPERIDPRRLDQIFQQLLDTELEMRAARLAALCGDNQPLRDSLETLLAASEIQVELDRELQFWRKACWRCIVDTRQSDDEIRSHLKNFVLNGGFRD